MVLVVMVGEQVQEMQAAGWLANTPVGVGVPHWMGTWLAVFPNVEGLVAQAGAVALALGSYFLAEERRVRRPRRRGEGGAVRLGHAPAAVEEGAVRA